MAAMWRSARSGHPVKPNSSGRRHHSCSDLQQMRFVVKFGVVRSLATPRPSDAAWWGGVSGLPTIFAGEPPRRRPRPHEAWVGGTVGQEELARAPHQASEGNVLRQRCDARLFKPLPIEIIARRKVTPAFEPQNPSGRGTPASECNAMDASGPAALACCACSQHQACGG